MPYNKLFCIFDEKSIHLTVELQFRINYHTKWGENVWISIIKDEKSPITLNIPMTTTDGQIWNARLDWDTSDLTYHYYIEKNGLVIKNEAPYSKHKWTITEDDTYFIEDYWYNNSPHIYLNSNIFTQCLFPNAIPDKHSKTPTNCLRLKVKAFLPPDKGLGILGSVESLGNWDPHNFKKLKRISPDEWEMVLEKSILTKTFEYKYITYNINGEQFLLWEEGKNRSLPVYGLPGKYRILLEDFPARFPNWQWKSAGVVIPLFALKSRTSYGVGDLGDLKKLVDWTAVTGMSAIQLLPINDTIQQRTWRDSYPYNSISVFAIHPMYINLQELGPLKNKEEQQEADHLRETLNSKSTVDYEQVNQAKRKYLEIHFRERGKKELESRQFSSFFANNKEWLLPYGAFCYLRDLYGTADFRLWPRFSKYDSEQIESLWITDSHAARKMAFYFYIQYILDKQLKDVHEYARQKGILIKGDIPIGVSRNSVPAWVNPEYFHFDCQAGAPPDNFATEGQNWGFPTYNWREILKNDCLWWKKRLQKMSQYFDAYRIDHILGFFRIWTIPYEYIDGTLGHFSPALPLSAEEIKKSGFPFDPNIHAQPHISAPLLTSLFGKYAHKTAAIFLQANPHDKTLSFTDQCHTQRELHSFARTQKELCHLFGEKELLKKLDILFTNRLFIEDPEHTGFYHPRIQATHCEAFQNIPSSAQESFNKLYEDFYYHRHNSFWRSEAMKKIPQIIHSTHMLACAEDLGMIPDCVKDVLSEEQILSLEVQRMPKHSGVMFDKTEENPYLSVATISTHDMPPLRLWWIQNPDFAQAYYHDILNLKQDAPRKATPEICENIIRKHLNSPSMLCLLSLQDWLSINSSLCRPNPAEEQINIPSNPNHYWNYRMHLTLEKLITCTGYNDKIHALIVQSGRTSTNN